MKHPNETAKAYNLIRADLKMDDTAMSALGITKQKIDDAIHKAINTGLSPQHAIDLVIYLWKQADPTRIVSASFFEMTLMGFEYNKDTQTWKHTDVDLTITEEQRNTLSFTDIEKAVLSRKPNP